MTTAPFDVEAARGVAIEAMRVPTAGHSSDRVALITTILAACDTLDALAADKRDLVTQLAKSTAAIAKVAGERDAARTEAQRELEHADAVLNVDTALANTASRLHAQIDAWRFVTGADTPEALAAELAAYRAIARPVRATPDDPAPPHDANT